MLDQVYSGHIVHSKSNNMPDPKSKSKMETSTKIKTAQIRTFRKKDINTEGVKRVLDEKGGQDPKEIKSHLNQSYIRSTNDLYVKLAHPERLVLGNSS